MKVKVKSESEVKVMLFWSFDFPETFIYYKSCIYLKRYKRKMCTAIVLWVYILDKLEGWTQEKQIRYRDLDFLNFEPKSIGSSVSDFSAKFWFFQKFRLKGFRLEN